MTLNFMAAVTLHSEFGAQENKISHCFPSGNPLLRSSWAFQWLRLYAFTAEDPDSSPCRGTKIPQAMQHSKRKKERKNIPLQIFAFVFVAFPLPCNFRCAVPWHFWAKTDFLAFPAWPLWIYIRPPNPHLICIQEPTWQYCSLQHRTPLPLELPSPYLRPAPRSSQVTKLSFLC